MCCWTCFSVGLLFCYISLGYAAAALCSCSQEQQQQHKVYEEHYNNRIFAFSHWAIVRYLLFTADSQMETWIIFLSLCDSRLLLVVYCMYLHVHFAYHHSSYFVSAIVVFSHTYFLSMSIDTHRASQMHERCAFNWK